MIYSRRAFETEMAALPVVCVEQLDGAPLSYMTRDAALRLQALSASVAVVPVTTRTVKQFKRVQLPGAPWHYAITSNGGTILVDGVADARWRTTIDRQVRTGAELAEIEARLRDRVSDSWVDTLRIADRLFVYLVAKPGLIPEDFVAEWDAWCRGRGWWVSRQGRKIYTIPTAVDKGRAVAEVVRRLRESGELSDDAPVFAAGDGALDAPMLRAADAAIRPRHGELEYLGWTHPSLTVTRASGIRAGAEIVDWFLERIPE
ncbi:HAD family hydrolase [Nocardia panacis]|uniref:HAD family hydrolase n=1 Tax=Nocardia panacis TaxID=2340916 RepID=A0A3A4JZJ8_9NOCA|nr:HAD family hydrolase [Nocardia panacis]RJO76885.1 HAD family hydrolase [Nocardia panacis]